jgi:hypothetical protein
MLTISHALLNNLISFLVMFIEHGNSEDESILRETQKHLKRFKQKCCKMMVIIEIQTEQWQIDKPHCVW